MCIRDRPDRLICCTDHVVETGTERLLFDIWARRWPRVGTDIELVRFHIEQHRIYRSGATRVVHFALVCPALPGSGRANTRDGDGVEVYLASDVCNVGACGHDP